VLICGAGNVGKDVFRLLTTRAVTVKEDQVASGPAIRIMAKALCKQVISALGL
jgi:homoserine dehydrogenase